MELIIAKDPEELSRELAGWMTEFIRKTIELKGACHLVLSGGKTPEKLYRLLAEDPFREKISWEKLHIYWGDERYVPFSDERNNAKLAFETLLSQVPVNKEQVHRIDTDLPPDKAAAGYEKLLRKQFPDPRHTFDLVLLGMGANAHTLSLFPGQESRREEKHWVISTMVEEVKMQRITLTAPVVNAARAVVFMVCGADKAPALKAVLEGDYRPETWPAQLIRPGTGDLYWWVDEAAAADLTN